MVIIHQKLDIKCQFSQLAIFLDKTNSSPALIQPDNR